MFNLRKILNDFKISCSLILIFFSSFSLAVEGGEASLSRDVSSEYFPPDVLSTDWDGYRGDIEVLDSIYQNYPWKLNVDEVWFDSLQIPSSEFSREEYILDSDQQMNPGIGYGAYLNVSESLQYIFYSNWQPNVPANGNAYALTLNSGVATAVVATKIPGSTRTHVLQNLDGTQTVIMPGIDEGSLAIGEEATKPSYQFDLQSLQFIEMPVQDIAAHHSIVFDFDQDGDDDIMATTWGADNRGVIFRNDNGIIEIVEVKTPIGYSMNGPFYDGDKLGIVLGDVYIPAHPEINIDDNHNFIAYFDPSMKDGPVSYKQLPLPYFDREEYLDLPTRFSDGQHRSHDVASTIFDMDGDGDQDILISTMLWNDDFPFGNLQILINENGEYLDESDDRLYNWLIGGNGAHQVDIADVNQDGFPDILLSDHGDVWFNKMFNGEIPLLNTSVGAGSKVLLNDGDGHFITVAHQNISKPFSYQASHIPSVSDSGLLRWTSINSRADGEPNKVAVEVVTLQRPISTGPNGIDPADFGVPDFNEFYYLLHNEEARKAVADEKYSSGLEHYIAIGQFQRLEINAHRADSDLDGVRDYLDEFPNDPTNDSDNDGVGNNLDVFPSDPTEFKDSDLDGVGDNADLFDDDSFEAFDNDLDGIGDNADADDDNDGFTDEQERADGTDPLSRFSCRTGCFSFDVDESLEAQPLTDGLLVIRHLFGFSGDSLTSGAVSGEAIRDSSEAIAGYLTDADSQLDIDGDGESKPLTDGLLPIRYLFGFSGDSLISGAIGSGAERDTAEAVEAYIKERIPDQ